MNVPRNVLWFEVLLYATLLIDALSAAFSDRTPKEELTSQTVTSLPLLDAGFLLLFTFFVFLAARYRKNWPRWVLLVALVLSAVGLLQDIVTNGVEIDNGIQVVSHALAALGLYYSFTGDAQGWFNA